MKFGTILADPPWAYGKTSRHEKLSGYSDAQYPPLTTGDLCDLPVGDLARDDSVLMLWSTWPFLEDAYKVIRAWGFQPVTALPWVKVTSKDPMALQYGVGYWFRGAAEPLLIGKRKKAYRTNHTGILAPGMKHSRKPDGVYELAETGDDPFPGPRLELFGRRSREGWTVLGNEAPGDGLDIRDSLRKLTVE